MVSILMKSTLREIKQSLGRYLAILAIVALGVGFFAGLRMSQPSMLATGVKYLNRYQLHDFRLLSTLGFTQEDVEAFGALEEITLARGSVYTEFLWQKEEDNEVVLIAHELTEGINEPELKAGRLPEKANECLGDASYFTQEDIGRTIKVAASNDEDTLELLNYEEYTLVGVAASPMYLNFERGTAGIGSGSIDAFVLMPEGAFDAEAHYEVYLCLDGAADPYSEEYQSQIDEIKPKLEALLEERADLRYRTLYNDALEEIRDGEQELADGWEEYRTERADAEQELADAYQELRDGEKEYADGLADYEQGKLDYADGLKEYEDGVAEVENARKELEDAKIELSDGKAELANAKAELEEAKLELEDSKRKLEEGRAELEDAKAEVLDGKEELADAKKELDRAKSKLNKAERQLAQAEESCAQLSALYQSGVQLAQAVGMGTPQELIAVLQSGMAPELNAAVDQGLQAQGSSLEEFLGGWTAAETMLGQPLTAEAVADMESAVEEGWGSYMIGLREYRQGLKDYEEGLAELEDAERKIAESEQELADGEAELADGEAKIADGEAEIAKVEQEIADAEREIADAEQELADAEQELADAAQELADAKEGLDKAPGELADARQELSDGWKEYEDGVAEAETEFADAEADLADGEQEIADAYVELSDLKKADTYTLTRKENVGYASFDNDISIIASVSLAFPVFFFLVAALVCMTTMKRMVDEQRTQIGVLKAIGYSRGQIIGKYLFYSGSAALIGAALGYTAGSRGLPLVIWEIYGMMYGFAPLEHVFDPVLAAVSFGAALLCSVGATYLSCRLELQNPAAQLIRPKAPKAGKRIFLEYMTPLWKRMSFLRKVSARNVLRYKSRLIMMILGIGGCTALLVVGYGIRDSVGNLAVDQHEKITLYDYAVNFQEPQTQERAEAFLVERGWEAEDGLLVHSGSTDVVFGDMTQSVYLVVPADNRLDGFIDLHDGERAVAFPKAGEVVLNYGLAEEMGVSVGDTVQLRDKKLGTVEAKVSGICDNYIFNYAFVSPDTYGQQLGSAPAFKTLLVQARPGADPYEENVYLADGEGISSVTVNAADRDRVTSMLSRLDIVVVVVVLFAAALAFVVLYNLTNINITERIREIATVKVLGFYQNEVAAYVFREIVTLSAVGGLAGLGMGKALHAFIMLQIRVDGMFFPNRIAPSSYLISYLLTMVFSILISCCMRPRLKKIDMAESLKSIE